MRTQTPFSNPDVPPAIASSKDPFKPFLANKGTVGTTPFTPPSDKVLFNRKRSNRVSSLKRKNYELLEQVRKKITGQTLSNEQLEYTGKLSKNLKLCAAHSLYRKHLMGDAIEYVGSHTCDHKLCMVCNSLRQKRLRRKYMLFFKNNPQLLIVRDRKTSKQRAHPQDVVDKMQGKKGFDARYELVGKQGYDVMHLTLTVPHYKDSGFRGYALYYDAIGILFNRLRKEKTWNQWVYGGEYGIETTRSENGLNIHIHSLLLVKQFKQNRNQLHKYILERWNRLSINPYSAREYFNEQAKLKIFKSNALLLKEPDFVDRLHPKGSTIITLENIYNIENGKKERVTEFGSDPMMKAVMEAISYHFQPQCFNKDKEEYDLDLMLDIMPVLEGKPLYRKFGCLHGQQSLNIKSSPEECIQEDFSESEQQEVIHPDTLCSAEREEYEFLVTDPAFVWHIAEQNLRPVIAKGAHITYLHDPPNTLSALFLMSRMAVAALCKHPQAASLNTCNN
jgi:hypothetical protein